MEACKRLCFREYRCGIRMHDLRFFIEQRPNLFIRPFEPLKLDALNDRREFHNQIFLWRKP
jgi:hypothetical protein